MQISRITNIIEMEKSYNKLETNLKEIKKSTSQLKKLFPIFIQLMEYYESEQRKKDYDDVNSWKLKLEWPHWILWEDTIYDFYIEQKRTLQNLSKIINKFLGE